MCAPATYAAELQPPSLLPDADDFLGRLELDAPSGEPSSEGALEAGYAAAAVYAADHADTISEVVLLVSSFGGTCEAATLDDVVAQLQSARDGGIRTWIVAGQALSNTELTTLVESGGGTKLSTQRASALGQLPGRVKACQYLLPEGAETPRVGR